MSGKLGKILYVDLGSGAIEERALPEEVYARWIGGTGLALGLLSELIPPGADPLGPDNVLAFMPGRLTGTGALMAGRWSACAKSPLTGGWGDANCGGTFSPAIKRLGWDGILVSGISPRPVLLVADADGPRLEEASALWGLDAIEAEERLAADFGGGARPAIACIGPAAERLSLISGISNDGGRYAARSGLGAVMGSKRLKALVLAGGAAGGAGRIPCADPARVRELSAAYAAEVAKVKLPSFMNGRLLPLMGRFLGLKTVYPMDGILAAGILGKWGTIYNNEAGVVNGDSPVKNWAGSRADFGARRRSRLDPDRIVARETKKYRCHSCVVGCGGLCAGPGGRHAHKPEYETCCAFGPLILNDDLEAVFACNDFCNRSGLDTISAGSTVAFAMECWERGILTAADTGGLELRWGDGRAALRLLELMAAREGVGELLADGVARAALRIGRGAEACAVHSGGQEPGMHDSRFDPMMGLSYVADPTPGRHTIGAAAYYNVSHLWEFLSWAPPIARPYPKARDYEASGEEALKAAAMAGAKQLLDASGGCLFALATGLQHWRLFDLLSAATGEKLSPDDWMERGLAIQRARAAFNAAQGIDDFAYHPRLAGKPPLGRGPLAGLSVPLDEMRANYLEALTRRGPAAPAARAAEARRSSEPAPGRGPSAAKSP